MSLKKLNNKLEKRKIKKKNHRIDKRPKIMPMTYVKEG